jgi:imidazole glycerol-phosphate synthase subunit HisH
MGADAVLIIDTGVANIASLLAAFERLGRPARLTDSPQEVRDAAYVVLPGVGAFGAGMERLAGAGLDEALRERIGEGGEGRGGRATLAVCLGLQLLCETSEESSGVAGLGIIGAQVTRFDQGAGVRVPQFGWNHVEPEADSTVLRPGYAYFANTYRLGAMPAGWTGATAEHGGSFVAALERDGLLACQFHPELSGRWGSELLGRWLEQ